MKKDIIEEIEFLLIPRLIGYLSPDELDIFFNQIKEKIKTFPINDSNRNNLLRLLQNIPDIPRFVKESVDKDFYTEVLFNIAVHSNYLSDILILNPEFLHFILLPSNLYSVLDITKIEKSIRAETRKFLSVQAKVNFLKNICRRYTLLIAVQDILKISDYKSTVKNISDLAVLLLSILFDICICQIACDKNINPKKIKYVIMSLGKLGGHELNYSSDVDLIAFFDKNNLLDRQRDIYSFDILNESIKFFIRLSSEITEKGFLYRIDFRLRPDGKNAPLCRTFTDTIHYYESRGSDWERQMLLKAGFLCGDKSMYDSFHKQINSFIYPLYKIKSPFEVIASMKKSIEERNNDDMNIKLAAGTIRDIEFLVQALQLIYGRTYKNLRNGNTSESLVILNSLTIITDADTKILESAYLFYRKIEHYVQLIDFRQTHSIPDNPLLLERLSSFLGFSTPENFLKEIEKTKKSVRKIFNSFISSPGEKKREITIKFSDNKTAEKNFQYLRKGINLSGIKVTDSKSIELYHSLEPLFLKYLSRSENPDELLNTFCRLIAGFPFPAMIYSEFSNDNNLFTDFLTICEFSDKCVNILLTRKSCFDLILSRSIYRKIQPQDFESIQLNDLLFLLSAQYTLHLIDSHTLSSTLASYIIFTICRIFDSGDFPQNIAVASLGSLGSGMFTFSSDIDLIFLSDNAVSEESLKVINICIEKIKKALLPFEVDLRLRPEGSKGNILWSIESTGKYLKERARLWEFMAYSKLKFISGSRELFSKCREIISNSFLESGYITSEELLKNYKMVTASASTSSKEFNIKKDPGGLIEIEFAVFSKIIKDKTLYNVLLDRNEDKIYKTLWQHNSNEIKKIKKLFFSLIIDNQILLNMHSSSISKEEIKLKRIENFRKDTELLSNINSSRKFLTDLFNELINR